MRHFPAFLELHGRAAFVLGEGEAADGKAALLAHAGAVLHRAPRFPGTLPEGCAIAIGAGAPEEDLRALSVACLARGIPVNIVDRTALCSFVMPAIVDRAPLTIGISTGGAAPVLARLVRARVLLRPCEAILSRYKPWHGETAESGLGEAGSVLQGAAVHRASSTCWSRGDAAG